MVHELGHVSTPPGEHHFRGGVVNANDRRAHFLTGAHRLPGARVDVLTGAKSRPQRGAQVWAEDGDSVVNARRVPPNDREDGQSS